MATLNNCRFIGRIGKKPEIRTTKDNKKVASFSLAVDESYKNKNKEKVEQTEWIRIVVFNEHLVNVIGNYADKGSLVYLEGKIKTRKYTDKEGVEKTITEIVLQGFDGVFQLLGSKNTNVNEENSEEKEVSSKSQVESEEIDSDSIPF